MCSLSKTYYSRPCVKLSKLCLEQQQMQAFLASTVSSCNLQCCSICTVGIAPSSEQLNVSDFLRWKSKIEEETSSSYISRTKVNREKEVYRYYECCRSGKYVPKGKGQRCLKSQKSAKIGQKCPSRIKLKISESTYFVQYFKDHAGHGTDLEHLRLPTSFRAAVAGK